MMKDSQQKEHIQTTINFSILSTKKGKNKVVNYDEEIKPSNTINQLRQTTLNFPSSIIHKKRSFNEINTDSSPINGKNDNDSDNETTDDNKSGDDNSLNECSNDEYNEFPLDGEPHMCAKEKKLRRHKYFLRLIDPKKIQCICGKELKLDKRYSPKNLKIHIHSKKACSAKTQGQASIEKYFKTSNIELVSKRQSYPCQGLSSDEIKQYVLKCPLDFGGSRNETELACQLFPQKFNNGHLVYSKLSYSERQELYKAQKAHASWILDRGNLSVTSAKCNKFTHHESKICNECSRLKNNSRFRDAISTTRATEKTFKYTTKRHLRDNRLTQLLGNDKLKALYGDAIEDSNESQMWSKLSKYGKKVHLKQIKHLVN
ncbi:hypothetical protein F8M41_007984 [Gigaspora margarita]|uniref:Uncharacterized protein n=1 Tax=Gigaspora margarita TaxID=4874 RepID=A0A8H4AVX9_GIGMA|nr:hypothetical protein F8M41_007984 [Gigaspora margarita]